MSDCGAVHAGMSRPQRISKRPLKFGDDVAEAGNQVVRGGNPASKRHNRNSVRDGETSEMCGRRQVSHRRSRPTCGQWCESTHIHALTRPRACTHIWLVVRRSHSHNVSHTHTCMGVRVHAHTTVQPTMVWLLGRVCTDSPLPLVI